MGAPHLDSIQIEEYQGRGGSRSLVPVRERVIARNVKEVGGGHFEHVGVEVLTAHARPGHLHGGFEQAQVPDFRRSAETPDLVEVDEKHFLEFEE